MSKDPAFLFYPGDASEDTQHMNRLERGAYFDILKAQKRFGRFTIEHLKKVLGSDFESVWPALDMCLSCVDHMYFIGWADESNENVNTDNNKDSENEKMWTSHKQTFLNAEQWDIQFLSDKKTTIQEFKKLKDEFIKGIELQTDFKDVKSLRSHFFHWFNKKLKDRKFSEINDRPSGPPLKPLNF